MTDVSAIVPAYNAAAYVGDALRSVLEQDPPPDEIVVVDDGSTDDTAALVEAFGAAVRLQRIRHAGYATALNTAVSASSGTLLAFQDADDLWTPGRLALQVAALAEDTSLDAVTGHLEAFISPELLAELDGRYRVLPPSASYQFQSMVIRRDAFDRVGPLDPETGTSAMIDWGSRARAAGIRTLVLDEVVSRRRIHDSNMGVRLAADRRRDLLRTIREHRHRREGPA